MCMEFNHISKSVVLSTILFLSFLAVFRIKVYFLSAYSCYLKNRVKSFHALKQMIESICDRDAIS